LIADCIQLQGNKANNLRRLSADFVGLGRVAKLVILPFPRSVVGMITIGTLWSVCCRFPGLDGFWVHRKTWRVCSAQTFATFWHATICHIPLSRYFY